MFEQKILLFFSETLFESGSAITTSALSRLNPSVSIVLTSSTALLTSVAILITIDHISKLKSKIYFITRSKQCNYVTI